MTRMVIAVLYSSISGIVLTVLVLITTSLTYEEVYCWSSVYRPCTALTCSVLNLAMSEKVYIYIYIYIYLTEWVLENWWYENRTNAVTLVPMPLWTFILISTFSFTLISVLHIDVNGRGSTAPSDVCANRPICASCKGLWCVRRILCDFCANSIFLKADNVRPLYWFNRSSIKFLTIGTILCFMYTCSYFILP